MVASAADALVADPFAVTQVSAGCKPRFATDARLTIEHAHNRILHCSVEVVTDTVDFDYSLNYRVAENPCNSIQVDGWALI